MFHYKGECLKCMYVLILLKSCFTSIIHQFKENVPRDFKPLN